jgi:hypothetical protein
MESNHKDEITEIYKNLLNGNHEVLGGIVHSYSNIAQRFPLELSKLLYDLKDKTDDVFYAKEVLETYFSIMNDVQVLLDSMTLAIESSNQLQTTLNQ